MHIHIVSVSYLNCPIILFISATAFVISEYVTIKKIAVFAAFFSQQFRNCCVIRYLSI